MPRGRLVTRTTLAILVIQSEIMILPPPPPATTTTTPPPAPPDDDYYYCCCYDDYDDYEHYYFDLTTATTSFLCLTVCIPTNLNPEPETPSQVKPGVFQDLNCKGSKDGTSSACFMRSFPSRFLIRSSARPQVA